VLRALAFAILLGHFLFAHGCHGNEDHELFQQLAPASEAAGLPAG
jgi:hypothetical protein